jgi:nucleoside-diphosphate kinase
MMGATDPAEAAPGTIRGDFGLDLGRNVVHGSDHEDPGSNEREISLFFDEDELEEWEQIDEGWLYE